ncbi:hypothetical protein Tsubulata_000382 [Turnera subulata]|uniref:Uncharacterized protein n=1 Tax=Turnera subulata TaxID=218843 RepID=A0A9Q0F159_9ROSI|nr:hypothetical protein Tsubulata_000382 [Turnera subulata]
MHLSASPSSSPSPLPPFARPDAEERAGIFLSVLSYDGVHSSDSLVVTAAGIALALSEVPNTQAVEGVRICLVNPTTKEIEESELDMLLAGTRNAILMIREQPQKFAGKNGGLLQEDLQRLTMIGFHAMQRANSTLEDFSKNHASSRVFKKKCV